MNNTLSHVHHHDNGGSSLTCNNEPVSFHGAASILSTHDVRIPILSLTARANTRQIIAPQTRQRTRERVAQLPLANPRTATTPIAGIGAVNITLRLLETGAALPIRGRHTLDISLISLCGLMPPAVRNALVGLHGAGAARCGWR